MEGADLEQGHEPKEDDQEETREEPDGKARGEGRKEKEQGPLTERTLYKPFRTVTIITTTQHSARSKILAHLRTLRASIAQARESLVHFKADRLDRDKLEPAARRVDDLMNMFASEMRDSAQGRTWIAEIQSGIDQVTNPKSAAALNDARSNITQLLELMTSDKKTASGRTH